MLPLSSRPTSASKYSFHGLTTRSTMVLSERTLALHESHPFQMNMQRGLRHEHGACGPNNSSHCSSASALHSGMCLLQEFSEQQFVLAGYRLGGRHVSATLVAQIRLNGLLQSFASRGLLQLVASRSVMKSPGAADPQLDSDLSSSTPLCYSAADRTEARAMDTRREAFCSTFPGAGGSRSHVAAVSPQVAPEPRCHLHNGGRRLTSLRHKAWLRMGWGRNLP